MVRFEDFERKHLHYQARTVGLKQQIGRDKKLLDEVRKFIPELHAFLKENRQKLGTTKAAKVAAWRDFWMNLVEPYR